MIKKADVLAALNKGRDDDGELTHSYEWARRMIESMFDGRDEISAAGATLAASATMRVETALSLALKRAEQTEREYH
jgi:hypothetical protein